MKTVKKQIWDKVLIESKRRVMSQVEAQVRRQSMYFQMKEFYYD